MPEQDVFIRKSSGLTRQIGALDALAYCAMNPGLLFSMVYLVWTPFLYPGANMPLAVLAVVQLFPIAGLYWLFSVSMPRSGGEYVYVSRTLSPALGFMVSFVIALTAISWLGILTDWWMKWALADGFRSVGILYHSSSLKAIADYFDLRWVRTVIGTLAMVFTGWGFMKGARWMVKLSYITVAFAVMGLIVFAIALLHGRQEFIANWNAWSSLKYNDVIKLATAAKYNVNFTFMATLMGGSTYVMLNTLGSTFSANMAGEIRGVQKSQFLALFGSLIIQMGLWYAFYKMAYVGWGAHWTNALMFLFNSGSKQFPMAHTPFVTIMIAFMASSPILIILIAIAFFVATFGSAAGLGFGPTRSIFAWSFDRILPPSFTTISKRWRSPLWVVWLSILAGWLFMLADIWTPTWTADIGYTITAWFAAWIFLGIAGMVFPYKRKEMYEASPPLVKGRLLGIPVISILGFFTTLVSLFVVIYMLIPYFKGTLPFTVWVMTIGFLVVPLIIYYIAQAVQKTKGMSFQKQFAEIPPE